MVSTNSLGGTATVSWLLMHFDGHGATSYVTKSAFGGRSTVMCWRTSNGATRRVLSVTINGCLG